MGGGGLTLNQSRKETVVVWGEDRRRGVGDWVRGGCKYQPKLNQN